MGERPHSSRLESEVFDGVEEDVEDAPVEAPVREERRLIVAEEVRDEVIPPLFIAAEVDRRDVVGGVVSSTRRVIVSDGLQQPVAQCVCHLLLEMDGCINNITIILPSLDEQNGRERSFKNES